MPTSKRFGMARVFVAVASIVVALLLLIDHSFLNAVVADGAEQREGADLGAMHRLSMLPLDGEGVRQILNARVERAERAIGDEHLPDVVQAFRYNHSMLTRLPEIERKRLLYSKASRISGLPIEELKRLGLEDPSAYEYEPGDDFRTVLFHRWLQLDRDSLLREALLPTLDALAASHEFPELWEEYVKNFIYFAWTDGPEVLQWMERYLWSYVADGELQSPEPILLILSGLLPGSERARHVLMRLIEADWLPLNRKATYSGNLAGYIPYVEFAPRVVGWLEQEELLTGDPARRYTGMAWVGVETLRSYGAKRARIMEEIAELDVDDGERKSVLIASRDAIPDHVELTNMLTPLLFDFSDTTQNSAIEAIASFGGEYGRKILVDLLADERANVKAILVALASKGKLFPEDVLPWLGDAEVGETAIFILHYLIRRDPSLYGLLPEIAFGDYPAGHRSSAFLAIAELETEAGKVDLLKGLELETDELVLTTILNCLARLGVAQLATMRQVAMNVARFDEGVRKYAYIEALRLTGKQGDSGAIPELLTRMATDSAGGIRAQGGLFLGAYAVANPGENGPTEWDDAFDAWLENPPGEVLDLIGLEGTRRAGASVALALGVGRDEIRAGISQYLESVRHPDMIQKYERWKQIIDYVDEAGIGGFHRQRWELDFAFLTLQIIGDSPASSK